MPEHVHLLVEVDPQYGIHRLVRAIKGRSSRLLRQEYPWLRSGCLRSGPTPTLCPPLVVLHSKWFKQYIENQKRV